MKINDALKALRQSKKITQSEAAEQLGISLSSYQKYEREKNSVVPSLDVLLKLADFYHVTTDYLLGRDVSQPTDPLDLVQTVSEMERDLLRRWLSLDEKGRGMFLDMLREVILEDERRKNQADSPEAQPPKLPGRVYYTAGEIEDAYNDQTQEGIG